MSIEAERKGLALKVAAIKAVSETAGESNVALVARLALANRRIEKLRAFVARVKRSSRDAQLILGATNTLCVDDKLAKEKP